MKVVSQQAMARRRQKYSDDPLLPVCANCRFYSSRFIENEWRELEEKRRRCKMGHFAVKRMGSCEEHAFKVKESVEAAQNA